MKSSKPTLMNNIKYNKGKVTITSLIKFLTNTVANNKYNQKFQHF